MMKEFWENAHTENSAKTSIKNLLGMNKKNCG